jgi:addiction module RelE/StbE family toxin
VASTKVKLIWTRRATRHLRAAYEYWAREKSVDAADAMIERIFAAAELLRDHPEMARGGRVPGARELLVSPTPFLLAYRIRRGAVQIVALLHGARKWPDNL